MMECCNPSDDDRILTSEVRRQSVSAGPTFCTWMTAAVVMSQYVHLLIHMLCRRYIPIRMEVHGPSDNDQPLFLNLGGRVVDRADVMRMDDFSSYYVLICSCGDLLFVLRLAAICQCMYCIFNQSLSLFHT